MKVKSESEVAQSCPTLVTPWTAAHQAPPSMGFSRQKYWSVVPLPSLEVGTGITIIIWIKIFSFHNFEGFFFFWCVLKTYH